MPEFFEVYWTTVRNVRHVRPLGKETPWKVLTLTLKIWNEMR